MPREGPPDTRPYLCVPYWTTPLVPGGTWDTGAQRPLPASVVSYLCPGIHPGPYQPGQPLSVSVDVRNSGDGNSEVPATVVVYWADPTLGFASPRFFAASTVSVPPGRTTPATATTPTMTAVIPADAPPHICLLVCVSHATDRAGTAPNPIGDRHWAQRNLAAVAAAPGAPAQVPFTAANATPDPADFFLQMRPTRGAHAELVAAVLGTTPADASATLRLLDVDGAPLAEGREVGFSFELLGHASRGFQLLLELHQELRPATSLGIEAALLGGGEQLRGSLGIVLTPPERR